MKVSYVTMQFPVPSETFASLDVSTLREIGVDVDVYGMRPKHRSHDDLVEQRGHKSIFISNLCFGSLAKFVRFLFFHPFMSFWLFCEVLKGGGRKHIVKGVLLFPSALSIFSDLHYKKPDVVHLFWGHYPALVGIMVERFMPRTILTQFLGAHDLIEYYPLSLSLAKRVPCLFTHSQENIPDLVGNGVPAEKIHVIRRGVDTKQVLINAPIRCFSGEISLLVVSRLIEEKGVDCAIRLAGRLADRGVDIRLTIAGDGPDKTRLRLLVEELSLDDKVCFLGHIPQNELLEIMAKTHFLVMFSRYSGERLPNAIKEAMLQGCVILSSFTKGIGELVDNGETGFLFESEDIDSAVEVASSLLLRPELFFRVSLASREKIINEFDVLDSMSKYKAVWDRLVEKISFRS